MDRRIRKFCLIFSIAVIIWAIASVKIPIFAQQSNINYIQLQTSLTAKNWQAADTETRRIVEQIVYPDRDFYDTKRIKNIPCDALRRLDNLWVQASNGRFGFSVQRRIWNSIYNPRIANKKPLIERFGQRIGWWRTPPQPIDDFPRFPWLNEKELNFSLNAPVGHLPWSGIESTIINNLYQESGPGCGSCTIDAMYLSEERNYEYLPALFERVGTCLRSRS